MKFFILAAMLAVAAVGAVPYGYKEEPKYAQEEPKYVEQKPNYATITKHEDVRNLDGSSSYSYESSDHITRQESQYQKQMGSGTGTVAEGSSSWVAPDGQTYSTSWVADEHGYRATGAHLPVAPPMPAEIAAMLPTLPKLTPEQLYAAPAAVAAPQAAYDAPKYEAPRMKTPAAVAPVAPVAPVASRYETPKVETPKAYAPKYPAPAPVAPAKVTYNRAY